MTPAPPPTSERTWTLVAPDGPVDLTVRAPEQATLGDLVAALSTALGRPVTGLWSGSTALPAGTPLTSSALRHGAVLGLGLPGPRSAGSSASGALEVHVVGGPDAGRTLALEQGDLVLGRAAGCGLALTDPDVSRRHAVVSVAEGRVSVADLGSSNGSSLDDRTGPARPVDTAGREWPVGATLRIGASSLRLTGPRGSVLAQAPAAGGRVDVRPLPSSPGSPPGVTVRWPAPPSEPTRRRLGWIAVALPAVGGLLMAWLLATPHFLFFALLSPVVAVGSWWSDRLSGRRTHRRGVADHAIALARADAELSSAVAEDLAVRDDAHPDVARLAAAARRRCSPLWSRTGDTARAATVRLGAGSGPSSVSRQEPGGSRETVPADHLPVALPLGSLGSLGIVGPRDAALGLARSVVCQLATLVPPTDLRLVLVCGAPQLRDWRWARWLPQLHGVVSPGDRLPEELLGTSPGAADPSPMTVVVLDGTPDAATAAALGRASPGLVRLDVAGTEAGLVLPALARVQVSGEIGTTGRLRVPGAEQERVLTLDALAESTADRLARDLAALAVPASVGNLPDSARLLDLPVGCGVQTDAPAGRVPSRWNRDRSRLTATLGSTGQGIVSLDLVADGPHALIAGTTGSGKSELLQTLVAGLALHHPPDRCSFLLVDYKGGAAFGEAAALPHTVGVLTDLDHQSTARALRSLAAELTRRERLLAEHRVRDLVDLPPDVPAARLVIVVDEFATLADELPGFVTGLVGIAQRGRSLGVHLVLATQRPGGVVSPEIRANCSLRICLRTTDESDARDVLGSTLPAFLSPDRPGRAYLRTGSTAPRLFQVARVSGGIPAAGTVVSAARRRWPPGPDAPQPARWEAGTPTDLERVVGALAEQARAQQVPAPHRPWLPPLPDELPSPALDRWAAGSAATVLRVGLCDAPDAQQQFPLELDLAAGGGWAFVGGPRSGRSTALGTVLAEAVHQLTAEQLHVHVLDHGGGGLARAAAAWPHTGTAVGRDDAHRTLRLLARLVVEADRRRDRGWAGLPSLLLLVDGYESLVGQLEEGDPATGAASLLRLLREGAAVGLTVALTAERAVPGSRVAAAVRTRVVLPLPDRADYAVAGIAARAVPGHRPPGRALVGEDAVECQLALPRADVRSTSTRGRGGSSRGADGEGPVQVVELATDPVLALPPPGQVPPDGELRLALGPGGDDGALVGVDLRRHGGLLVVGPPGSGRTTTVQALGRHARALGAAVLELAPDPVAAPEGAVQQLARTDAAGLRMWLDQQEGCPVVVLADDLTGLPEPVTEALSTVTGADGRVSVLAAGTAAELAACFRGPAAALRRTRRALVLRPGPGDGELLGLRLPRTPLPARPGSGWLVTATEVTRVQVARHRPGPT